MPDHIRPLLEDLPGAHTWVSAGNEIHASDHDLVITWGYNAADRPPPLHVLAFGAEVVREPANDWNEDPELARLKQVHARHVG